MRWRRSTGTWQPATGRRISGVPRVIQGPCASRVWVAREAATGARPQFILRRSFRMISRRSFAYSSMMRRASSRWEGGGLLLLARFLGLDHDAPKVSNAKGGALI